VEGLIRVDWVVWRKEKEAVIGKEIRSRFDSQGFLLHFVCYRSGSHLSIDHYSEFAFLLKARNMYSGRKLTNKK
jgi:hypothetical protein